MDGMMEVLLHRAILLAKEEKTQVRKGWVKVSKR